MRKRQVQIASFGQFHIPHLVKGLGDMADVQYLTNWSPKKEVPRHFGDAAVICKHLHYPLKAFELYQVLKKGYRMPYALMALFDRWLRSRIRRDIDALYLQNGCGLLSMRYFRSISSAPVVIDSGSTHTDWQHRTVLEEFRRNGINVPLFTEGFRRRCRLEVEEADYVQIPSQFVKRTYLQEGIPESKLLLAQYGTDITTFHPSTENVDRPFRVICASGFNLRKGARILVEAWRKLALKDAELHWVGGIGPDVAPLFDKDLPGLVKHPHLSHEELAELYRSCDVLVLPSFEEGLARVLIEGAASGLALIATPNSGVEDIFQPGIPMGWLIDSGSSESLCDAILQAAQDRDLTKRLGLNAARRAAADFGLESYFKRVCQNFQLLTSGPI